MPSIIKVPTLRTYLGRLGANMGRCAPDVGRLVVRACTLISNAGSWQLHRGIRHVDGNGSFRNNLAPLASIALALAPIPAVVAQSGEHDGWTCIRLRPLERSQATSASGSQQAGYVGPHAALWNATEESFVSLQPGSNIISRVEAISPWQQVGWANYGACLWTGTAESWVHLNPAGFTYSEAHAVGGSQQGGWALNSGLNRHAALWSGSAASFVDLSPLGSIDSGVTAIDEGFQGGYAVFSIDPSYGRAGMWNGTAASWIDLHPQGAVSSAIEAMSDGIQAGSAYVVVPHSPFPETHACIWRGTAESWVDINPRGAVSSIALATDNGLQVGRAYWNGNRSTGACIWSGTPESFVDLSPYRPAGIFLVEATGISHDETHIYVTGYGFSVGFIREALLWRRSIGPTCDSVDFNNDASLFDPQDIESFLSVYSSGPCLPASVPDVCNDVDFNNDGSLFDPCDISSFLAVYSEGPCTACGQ